MKIVPKILATGLAISFAFPIKPVKPAVPLILAPVICAKVCVLVGTTIVGGVTAYIWQHRTTKRRYFADVQGNLRKMLDDPEEDMEQMNQNSMPGRRIKAKSYSEAWSICERFSNGRKVATPLKVKDKENTFICRYY